MFGTLLCACFLAPSAGPQFVGLAGQSLAITLPASPTPWVLEDLEGRRLGTAPSGAVQTPAALGVGWYRYRSGGQWVSFGLVAPQAAKTPSNSPIGLDVAAAWFYGADRMPEVLRLCRLAGVSSLRDRLRWGEVETARGVFADNTIYDKMVDLQSRAGFQVLQVNHSTPAWAGANGKRFPEDLRDAYRFYRSMATRWKGKVTAWEPWNEADIDAFGGHTGAERAAFQKACFFGIRDGDPSASVGLNVWAGRSRPHIADLDSQDVLPYVDTYNVHHYDGVDGYPGVYGAHRRAAGSRPIWVTECAIPVPWEGDETLQEPNDTMLAEQASRVVKTFAGSVHYGSRRSFYFILPHYSEGRVQFGLLRPDLSPRPGYLALAAVGRLLAGAQPLGEVAGRPPGSRAFAFRAHPLGVRSTVVVAWSDGQPSDWTLPSAPQEAYDFLGRSLPAPSRIRLADRPVFLIYPERSGLRFGAVQRPIQRKVGRPSRIVLQPLWQRENTVLALASYSVAATGESVIPIAAYNFGARTFRTTVTVSGSSGWRVAGGTSLTLRPMDRQLVSLRVIPPKEGGPEPGVITAIARSPGQPDSVLRLRLSPEGAGTSGTQSVEVAGWRDPASWERLISGGPFEITADGEGVVFDGRPAGDRWVYPKIRVPKVPEGAIGLALEVQMLEGTGIFRLILDERTESSYVADFLAQPREKQTLATAALFESAGQGAGWSKPDPNGRLDLDQVVTMKIGFNTSFDRLRFRLSKVRWLVRR